MFVFETARALLFLLLKLEYSVVVVGTPRGCRVAREVRGMFPGSLQRLNHKPKPLPMPVFFRCKNCGQEHLSPLFFPDERSFAIERLGTMTLSCPVTSKTAPYDKRHMFWVRNERKLAPALRYHI